MEFFCDKCNEFMLYPNRHNCPPMYEVWKGEVEEDREYARSYYARYPEDAARKWGEEDDQYGDYTIVQGGGVEVNVAIVGDDEVLKYQVTGEYVTEYYATVIQ